MSQLLPKGLVADRAMLRLLPLAAICKDGNTQHRSAISGDMITEYAALMKEGVIFPPIRVWWDGQQYWLADGFHRLAAAERSGLTEIMCEVRNGTQSDAQWDSYAANTSHGLRWTVAETQRVIQLALSHPNAGCLSNVELAKHLHLSEHTVRRWRKRVPSTVPANNVRVVKRGNATYALAIERIGHARKGPISKSRKTLRIELALMKERGSPKVRRVLTVVGNWAFGATEPIACIEALGHILDDRLVSRAPRDARTP